MDNQTLFLVIALGLAIVFFAVSLKTSKTRKLKITLADNSIIEVTRRWNDNWNDQKDMKCYHVDKKTIWLATHWILRVEEM